MVVSAIRVGSIVGIVALVGGYHLIRTDQIREGKAFTKLALSIFFALLLVLGLAFVDAGISSEAGMRLGSLAVIGLVISMALLVGVRNEGEPEPILWYGVRIGFFLCMIIIMVGLSYVVGLSWMSVLVVVGGPGIVIYYFLAQKFREPYIE